MRFWMYLAGLAAAVMLTHAAGAAGTIPAGVASMRAPDQAVRALYLIFILALGAAGRRAIFGTCPG